MTERELLPCPFCGGGANIEIYPPREVKFPAFQGVCQVCKIHGKMVLDRDLAITAWNTRARPDEGEAVAWRWTMIAEGQPTVRLSQNNRISPFGEPGVDHSKTFIVTCDPLFAHPPRSPEPWRAPEGFVLALAEPTEDMIAAVVTRYGLPWREVSRLLCCYRDLLSAAPPAPLPGKDAPPIDTEEVG